MCKHRTAQNQHTCRGFYGDHDSTYCVYCLHKKYSDKDYQEIALELFPNIRVINWNGELHDPYLGKKHLKRIEECDLSYPIFITDNYEIIDGCHRLHKAHHEGHSTIKTIIISEDELKSCLF